MTTLVVGATGKTGWPLVEQLLGKNHKVRVIVRSSHKLPARVLDNPNMTVIEASVLDLTDEGMAEQVKNCDAVVSCLGYVINKWCQSTFTAYISNKCALTPFP